MKDLAKTWVWTGKQSDDFRRKNEQKQNSQHVENNQWNKRPPNVTIEGRPGKQEEINWRQNEKAFRLKLLEIWKTRTKMLSPNMFKFFVIFAGNGMVADAGRATNCRQKIKAPWLPTQYSEKAGTFENMGLNGKTDWRFQTKKKNINNILGNSKTPRRTHSP